MEPVPGRAYLSKIPECPVHKGPMRLDFAMDRYTCAGYDGEGCKWFMNVDIDVEEMLSELGVFGDLTLETGGDA